MYWIDAHAHISFFKDSAIASTIAAGARQNLLFWMMAGYDSKDWLAQTQAISRHKTHLGSSFGLHPWRVIEMSEPQIEQELAVLKTLLPQASALGETGIDRFKTDDANVLKRQIAVFEAHLELNKIHNLPLVLHVVRAENEALGLLRSYHYTGVVHGYSGSYESAKRYLDLGYKISVGRGVVSHGYKNLKACVDKLELEHILLESDAGLDDHGQPENAVDVFFKVVEAVAEIKNVSREKLLETNFNNCQQVFGAKVCGRAEASVKDK